MAIRKIWLCLYLLILTPSLFAGSDLYRVINRDHASDKFHLYYYFSFHCHACENWSPFYEQEMDKLVTKDVQIHYAPLAMSRSEKNLAQAFILSKGMGLKSITQDYFDLHNNSYYVSQKKVAELAFTHFKKANIPTDRWSEQNLAYSDLKLKNYAALASRASVDATPTFLLLGPTGMYLIYPSENLPPESVFGVIEDLISK